MKIGNFTLSILSIPPVAESIDGYVALRHGQTYRIALHNHRAVRCNAEVRVDGKEIGTWRLAAYGPATLEHPADDDGQFTFYRAGSAEAAAAQLGQVSPDHLGLVQVRFVPELPIPERIVTKGYLAGASADSFGARSYGAGGTGLSGQSAQQYGRAAAMDLDEAAAVTITLRLVEDTQPAVRPLQPLATGNPVPPPVRPMNLDTLRRLDELYAELPHIDCQQDCAAFCGPISMTKPEWERIIERVGYEPEHACGSLHCPMLNVKKGTCRVYAVRPLICRLWSLVNVEGMRCPHGCVPERWLSDDEGKEFLRRMFALADEIEKEEQVENEPTAA